MPKTRVRYNPVEDRYAVYVWEVLSLGIYGYYSEDWQFKAHRKTEEDAIALAKLLTKAPAEHIVWESGDV